MTRTKPKAVKKLLSQREIEGLEEDKRELETSLSDSNEYGRGTAAEQVDRSKVKYEIKKLADAIHEGTPVKPRSIEKDKLVKEEGQLEEEISAGMPTWYEMRQPTKNPGAVRKHMAWSDRNKVKIRRYKQIQRMLRPLEPKSIENLRKEK